MTEQHCAHPIEEWALGTDCTLRTLWREGEETKATMKLLGDQREKFSAFFTIRILINAAIIGKVSWRVVGRG